MIETYAFNDIQLIDTHVHRIHPGRAPEFGHIGGGYIDGPLQEYNARQTILYGMVMEALRLEFGLPETASVGEVEAERHRRYLADPQMYYTNLIKDQKVEMYCLEVGSPIGGAVYSSEEIEYFNASIPKEKRCSIIRIDRIIDDLLPEKRPFHSFIQAYHSELRSRIVKEKAVALKSCAAYYGGLDVEIADSAQAEKAYETIRQGKALNGGIKLLNNYILLSSMDTAVEFSLPIQFHTGMGNANYIDIKTMNPVYLINLLMHKSVLNRVKIVLLHGGHPHEEYTSYLTAQFSNVYTDFSGTFYLCSLKGAERMAALLERAPLNKVMYGSDGVMFPEVSWFSHKHFRRQLEKLFRSMVEEGYLTENRAMDVAGKIMRGNALQCYTNINNRSQCYGS